VHFLEVMAALEVTGLCGPEGLEDGSEDDVPACLFLLVLVRSRPCTLLARRYLHMHREFVPKSAEWGTYVLDNLPEHQWRNVVRMCRSTYTQLTGLLSEHLPESRVSWDRPMSVERLQRIALFRLGHYGNSASTLCDVNALEEVRVADKDH